MSEPMQYEDFMARSARDCRLRPVTQDGREQPELAAVLSEVGARGEQHGFEQFSLLFRVADGGVSRQGIYAVTFAGESAAAEIFLVPIGRDGTDTTYQACFNRVADAVAG